MGSSYFQEANLRSGSSRKGKKINSEKPKQPQRGLGVAQLEKIRLQGQFGINYFPPGVHGLYPPNFDQGDLIRAQKAYPSAPPTNFSYSSSSTSSAPYGFYNGLMMGLGEERSNMRHDDHQQSTNRASWDPSKNILEAQHHSQPKIPRNFLNLNVEDSEQTRNIDQLSSLMGSNNKKSRTSDSQEIDLELRLSI